MEALQKGVVHFTLGEEEGIRLMEIAMEHLIFGNDPVKALKTITDSLIGCPTEIALKILKGDMVLLVDIKDQTMIATTRIPEVHDKMFPKVDVSEYLERQREQIYKQSGELINSWRLIQKEIIGNSRQLPVNIPYESIFQFIAGNNESLLDDLRDNTEIEHMAYVIRTTKAFIEHVTKIQTVINWMFQSWKDYEGFQDQSSELDSMYRFNEARDTIHERKMQLLQIMQDTWNMKNFEYETELEDVSSYIDAVRKIEETINEGIKPVDIMDNWSAGWLSPEGEYYALNGEIANMLHNQLADALQEKGIVPKEDNNPDSWLAQNGWVKIHGNNIQFEGCLNDRLDKPIVDLTPRQIEIICQYGRDCHKGMLKVGWRRTPCTVTMFMMQTKNLKLLYQTYFNY